jgi:AcrR family transcriptional regulator
MATTSEPKQTRARVPAAERRDALIEAAVHEFAHGGLHGTPVDRIARRVGVAQPYVFSLFGSKKELFLAAVQRGVEFIADTFERAATQFDPATAEPELDVLHAMGLSYIELLHTHPDHLMIQHQMYAACDDAEIRERVRALYARLVRRVERLTSDAAERHRLPTPTAEQIDEFFRYGMWLNVAAAMGVEDLSAGCEWVRAETNK